MKYDDFVKKCKSLKDRDSFIKKHIVKTYLPYEAKISEAKEIVRRSCYREINGVETFYQDSTIAYMLFMLRIISNYTDIEYEEGADALSAFNALSEANLFEVIVRALPVNEYDAFNTVLRMVKDDEMENYRSLAGYLETKVEAISLALNSLAEATQKFEVKT